jgi:hypothetical protein
MERERYWLRSADTARQWRCGESLAPPADKHRRRVIRRRAALVRNVKTPTDTSTTSSGIPVTPGAYLW